MMFQQRDKTLAHHAGGSDHTYFVLFHISPDLPFNGFYAITHGGVHKFA